MIAKLVMFKENGERKDFQLESETTIVGRKEDCDLRIPLAEVSRRHAQVTMRGRKVTLRDLGSANGTYVNNKRVNEVDLRAGDHVVVGPVVFTVQIDGQPSDVRPVKTKLARLKQQAAEAGADTSDMEAAAIFGDDMDTDPISALEALAGRQDDDEPPPPKK